MTSEVMCVHEYALKAIEADLTDALTSPASTEMHAGLLEAARIVSVDKASVRRLASGRKRLQEISNTGLNSRDCPDTQQIRQALAKTVDEASNLFVSILRDLRKHDRQGPDEFGGEPAHPIWAENDELRDSFVESLRQLQDVAGKILIHVIGSGDELNDLVGDVADVSQGGRRVADVTPVVGKHFEDQQVGVGDDGAPVGASRDIDDAGVAVIEFLADPGDGVFTHRPSGHGDLLRLTKTDCLDIPVGVGETNGRHGRAVEVRQCQLKLERIRCGGEVGGDAVVPDSDRVPHDDSSTGTHPAATGGTDSVEGSSRRGDDSRPGGDGEVRS